jgi:hypothetical protein
MPNKTHRVREEDKHRIKCPHCDAPADICEHVEWNTGNTTGISFFYYCAPCFKEMRERTAARAA